MTGYLLDTHVVLWAAGESERLGAETRDLLEDPEQTILVSSVSIAEMVIKQSLGKLSLPVTVLDLIGSLDFSVLPLSGEHAQGLSVLPLLHRDPFDRLLLAQALHEGLTLVSSDTRLHAYPEVRVMAAG